MPVIKNWERGMKRVIYNTTTTDKKIFKYPQDISDIEEFVNDNYSLEDNFLCKQVCQALETKYGNLQATKINFMFMDGGLQEGGHYVCKVIGDAGQGCNLIDPTGDQFLGRTENMKCAAFHRGLFGYLSNDYKPMHRIESTVRSVWELVEELSEEYPEARLIEL